MSKCDVMPQQQQRPANAMSIAGVDGGVAPSRVRRTLFGRVDPEESLNFVKDELEKQMKLDQEKWNFDFLNERPLNGPGKRYEWVKVGHEVDSSNCSAATVPIHHVNGNCTVHEERNGGPNGQTYITDFMRKRKHASPQQLQQKHHHMNGTTSVVEAASPESISVCSESSSSPPT